LVQFDQFLERRGIFRLLVSPGRRSAAESVAHSPALPRLFWQYGVGERVILPLLLPGAEAEQH